MLDLPAKTNRVFGSSQDGNIRGLSGSIWAAMTPAQRAQAQKLIQNGATPEGMERIMVEIIRINDQQPIGIPSADYPNPLHLRPTRISPARLQ